VALDGLKIQLVDSLFHDARNPLNAIAIHLEVLTEKIRGTEAATKTESNLRAIRDQVTRVSAILRSFSEFLLLKKHGEATLRFSDLVSQSLEVLGYEFRRKGILLRSSIEPNLSVRAEDRSCAGLLVLWPLFRAIRRAPPSSQVQVKVQAMDTMVEFTVIDSAPGAEGISEDTGAIDAVCRQNGGSLNVCGKVCSLSLPLLQLS
jgi:signal transduction histidine kinase